MSGELQQNVTNALSRNAGTVSVGTVGSGVSTYLGWIPPTLGVIASVLGIVLTGYMIRFYQKRNRVQDLQISELEDRERQRLDSIS